MVTSTRKTATDRKRQVVNDEITAMNEGAARYPHSPQAEEAFIASTVGVGLNITPYLWVDHKWFFVEHWRTIWQTASRLAREGKAADRYVVLDYLRLDHDDEYERRCSIALDEAVRRQVKLLNSDIRGYAGIVHGHWQQREAMRIGSELANAGREGDFAAMSDLAAQARKLNDISASRQTSYSYLEAAMLAAAQIEQSMTRPEGGLLSGIRALDKVIGPFQTGQLVVISAATSMGKSGFGLSLALNFAMRFKTLFDEHKSLLGTLEEGALFESVEYLTLEMNTALQAMRAAAQTATTLERGLNDLIFGFREEYDGEPDYAAFLTWFEELKVEAAKLQEHFYFHQRQHSTDDIRMTLREAQAKGRLPRVLIVDAAEYLKSEERFDAKKYTDMYQDLKAIAEDFSILLIVMHQLNREVNSRADRRPELFDLKASGGVENAADWVFLLWRPQYYWPLSTLDIPDDFFGDEICYIEGLWLTIAKGRMSAAKDATIALRWRGDRTRVEDWPSDWRESDFTRLTNIATGAEEAA